jgi:YHS domain-containing protein
MTQVRDPVCGMTIERKTAAGSSMVYEGEEVFFCSERCRRAFDAEPERFVPERHEPPFTSKRGVTAPKFGSAGSGGLEHEPTPERHDEPGHRRKK